MNEALVDLAQLGREGVVLGLGLDAAEAREEAHPLAQTADVADDQAVHREVGDREAGDPHQDRQHDRRQRAAQEIARPGVERPPARPPWRRRRPRQRRARVDQGLAADRDVAEDGRARCRRGRAARGSRAGTARPCSGSVAVRISPWSLKVRMSIGAERGIGVVARARGGVGERDRREADERVVVDRHGRR